MPSTNRVTDESAKILHVITRLDVGGSAENTVISATRMPSPEFACSLISGLTEDPAPGAAKAVYAAGIPWFELPCLRRDVHPALDAKALLQLWKLIRGLRPDIVHTHSSKAGFLGRVAARLAGVRHVVHTPHGHVFDGYFGRGPTRAFIALERWAARFTDRIITLTDAEAAQHLAVGIARPEQFVTIPSGVELCDIPTAAGEGERVRDELGLASTTPLIGAISRLVPIKGLQHLIAATPEILRRCPEAHLVIAGDGEQRAMLEAMARDAGLESRVHFLGYRQDVAAVTAALDVFVLPSINEGQGRVLVYAMALGKPIVASRVGGVPELLGEEEAGWLVPPADPTSLAHAVGSLLEDPRHAAKLGDAARARAPRYSVEAMLAALAKLYREVMAT
ncbi:MAG: glycosyltransferase family 4 protein [Candidatus Methylomirabilales bacterium]